MRSLVLLVPLLALAADERRDERRPVFAGPGAVIATPIALDPDQPTLLRVGKLDIVAAWELTSPDPAFGGVSAMTATATELTLVSDAGGVTRIALDRNGHPGNATFADLPGPGGMLKRDRDSEAMTADPRTGRVWVAFEGADQVWRYASGLARAEAGARPEAMRQWPANGGAEAMTRLADGRFLVFSERGKAPPGAAAALRFDRDPTEPDARVTRFHHRPPSGFSTTDAATLPDGRVLLLHRRAGVWPLFTAKLTIVDPAAIREDEILTGEEIATFSAPLATDNYEALAVVRERGRTVVWIASDDNFSRLLQRTLLLKLSLSED